LSIGFTKIINLKGGLDMWALEVDNNMQRY